MKKKSPVPTAGPTKALDSKLKQPDIDSEKLKEHWTQLQEREKGINYSLFNLFLDLTERLQDFDSQKLILAQAKTDFSKLTEELEQIK